MSKRRFETYTGPDTESRMDESPVEEGTTVEVVSGWDPPMGRLFLVIYRLDGRGGRDVETLYSNLDASGYGPASEDAATGAESLSSIKRRLRDFAIEWPEEWMDDIGYDAEVGNDMKMGARETVDGTRAGSEVEIDYGFHERMSFEERLEKELDRTPGLADAIQTLHQTGATGMDPPIMGALFRLGLVGSRERDLNHAVSYLLREGHMDR